MRRLNTTLEDGVVLAEEGVLSLVTLNSTSGASGASGAGSTGGSTGSGIVEGAVDLATKVTSTSGLASGTHRTLASSVVR